MPSCPQMGLRRAITRPNPVVLSSLGVALGGLWLTACSDTMLAPSARPMPPGTLAAAEAPAEPPPVGIGGAFVMAAGGDQVAPIAVQSTGISIPAGTQVEVKVEGAITRTQTAGLKQFCDLPNMRQNCNGPWASLLVETPFLPSGDDSFQSGAAKASVSWANGETSSPDSGSSSAYVGAAGGELWAGRSGYQCWYVDNWSGLQGACFTFGGAYIVTVSARPSGSGGGGSGGDVPTLKLSILRSNVGASGGSADLAAIVETASGPTALGSRAITDEAGEDAPVVLGFSRWYFVPDAMSTVHGDPEPSPFEMQSAASVQAETTQEGPVRLDADRVRLPDGRIVGSGLWVTRTSASTAASAVVEATGAVIRASVSSAAAGRAYTECDGSSTCYAEFDAPAGTFVVSTTIDGVPVSASARVGVVPGGPPVQLRKAAGRNPGGSFTSFNQRIRPPEHFLDLEAVVDPSFSGEIGWEIVDDPSDRIDSPHLVFEQQAKTTAGVGSMAPHRRWPAHPGSLDQKAIRYIVRAWGMADGRKVYTAPVVVTQTVQDVIREEYIERSNIVASLVPASSAFTHELPSFRGIFRHGLGEDEQTGLGDYCVNGETTCTTLVSERLTPFVLWLQGQWDRDLQVNSILRNPVHHFEHEGYDNLSPHVFGTAIDYQALGPRKSLQQKQYWMALRNIGLTYPEGVCSEPWYLGKAWMGHHVHFDRRYPAQNPCPRTWKQEEDVTNRSLRLAASGSDSLLAMLQSDSVDLRAAAASELSQLPAADLPVGYGTVALAQLQVELLSRARGVETDYEEYGAYLLDLVQVVHRAGDPAAAPTLAKIGIDASLGARRFVARYAAATIPALEELWSEEHALHADVIGTYGEMLRFQADSGWTLTDEQAAVIDRAFVRAVSSGPVGQWGVAFFSSYLRLVEYAPLVQHLLTLRQSPDDPMGLVADAATSANATLQALLSSADAGTLMRSTLRLHSSMCTGATAARLGQCTALARELGNADRAIEAGQVTPARAALTTYLSLLDNAAGRGIFGDDEALLLRGNAQMVREALP